MTNNVVPLFPTTSFDPEDIGPWLVRLGRTLIEDGLALHEHPDIDFVPHTMLVVLLNDEHIQVYRGGARVHEAVNAAHDHDAYQAARARGTPWYADTPEQTREKRRQWAAEQAATQTAYDQAHPHLCPICKRQRFKSRVALTRHQTPCQQAQQQFAEACQEAGWVPESEVFTPLRIVLEGN